MKKKLGQKKIWSPAGGHFDYRWKAENLIRWSPYSWVTSRKKLERYNNYFSSYCVNKNFFKFLTMTLGKKSAGRGWMNYEFNLLHHVGVVAKRVRAAAHEGDDNTPSGPTGRGVKMVNQRWSLTHNLWMLPLGAWLSLSLCMHWNSCPAARKWKWPEIERATNYSQILQIDKNLNKTTILNSVCIN